MPSPERGRARWDALCPAPERGGRVSGQRRGPGGRRAARPAATAIHRAGRLSTPFDLEQDSHGRFYLSDPGANKVYQLDRAGKILRTFGRLTAQKPGSYDPETFMSPGKLATWRDPDGNDRLLVVDQAGPTNTSEWNAEGRLLRQFIGLQTNCQ